MATTELIIGVLLFIVIILVYYFVFHKPLVDSNKVTLVTTPSGQVVAVQPSETQLVTSDLHGKFLADDQLVVKVNGAAVIASNAAWNAIRNVDLPAIKQGSVIEFVVTNSSGAGGLLGAWTWAGKRMVTNAAQFPDKENISAEWAKTGHPELPGASWIWSSDKCENCVNTFKWVAQ